MRRLTWIACIALVLAAAPAQANPEDLANDISSEVMSPFCPGVTLHDCPSERATDYRAKIVGWAEAGWSEQRIMARIHSDFGRIDATPPASGAGILAWILPGIAVLLGGLLAFSAVRRWTARRSAPAAEGIQPVTAMAPEERRVIEAELEALRRSP